MTMTVAAAGLAASMMLLHRSVAILNGIEGEDVFVEANEASWVIT